MDEPTKIVFGGLRWEHVWKDAQTFSLMLMLEQVPDPVGGTPSSPDDVVWPDDALVSAWADAPLMLSTLPAPDAAERGLECLYVRV